MSVLSAALVFEVMVLCIAIGCAAGPWVVVSTSGIKTSYYLTHFLAAGKTVTYDSLESLDRSWVLIDDVGKASIALFVFGALCFLLCFLFGAARLCRTVHSESPSRTLALLSGAPSVTFAVIGEVLLLLATALGVFAMLHLEREEWDSWYPGSSTLAAALNIPLAFIAVLLDAACCCCCCCCCCCGRARKPMEEAETPMLFVELRSGAVTVQ
jgi:hypothetical protein